MWRPRLIAVGFGLGIGVVTLASVGCTGSSEEVVPDGNVNDERGFSDHLRARDARDLPLSNEERISMQEAVGGVRFIFRIVVAGMLLLFLGYYLFHPYPLSSLRPTSKKEIERLRRARDERLH